MPCTGWDTSTSSPGRFPNDTCLIYSIWIDHLTLETIQNFTNLVGKNMRIFHPSGHVTAQDLEHFITSLGPEKILIIYMQTEPETIGIVHKDRLLQVIDGEEIQLLTLATNSDKIIARNYCDATFSL